LPEQISAIKGVKEAVEVGAAGVKKEVAGIKTDTESGKKSFPKAPEWDFINKKADSINQISDTIDAKAKELNKALGELTVAEAERKRQEDFAKTAQKALAAEKIITAKQAEEIKSYIDGAKKRQQAIWATVTGFAALGLVIGIFLFIYAKSELGIALAVSSLILACISYFMAAYALIVAIIGGIILICVIIYLIYFLCQNKKALVETVVSLENTKRKNWDDPGVKQEVSNIQSSSTKKIVHDLRLERGLI
jgi:hypothetical protein